MISILSVSYASAASTASSSSSKALWSTNPITITFSHTAGVGSASDSFKCAPPYTKPVVLTTTVNMPLLVSLTTSPSSFPSCGPSFTSFTLTAHSTTPGTYSGTVTIRQGSQYGTAILPSLTVKIVVT
ncbi:MAG: hypothetical protein AUJ07_01580 [Crenarchaeota archaeon 13_1_40CM_3_53_5]|nr:MAG: hypothetical protein AUJ07_01580 [Crenarchaeota archaeon 13_1_40CM_3_53_5]